MLIEDIILIVIPVVVTFVFMGIHIYCVVRRKRFIQTIRVGDLFINDYDLDTYYRWLYEETHNPYTVKGKEFYYPTGTYIVRDIKHNDKGEIWVAYDSIHYESEKPSKHPLTKEINKFLDDRTRIKNITT